MVVLGTATYGWSVNRVLHVADAALQMPVHGLQQTAEVHAYGRTVGAS